MDIVRAVGRMTLAPLFESLLAVAAFKLVKMPVPWILITAIFMITAAAEAQNDWRNRWRYAQIGKMLASHYPGRFFGVTMALWVVSVVLVVVIGIGYSAWSTMLAIVALFGLVYPGLRFIPLIPTLTVALCSASVVLLPIVAGAQSWQLWALFVAITLLVFARELVKDLEHAPIDRSHRWSIPLAVGEPCTQLLAIVAVVVSALTLLLVSLWMAFCLILGFLMLRDIQLGEPPHVVRRDSLNVMLGVTTFILFFV